MAHFNMILIACSILLTVVAARHHEVEVEVPVKEESEVHLNEVEVVLPPLDVEVAVVPKQKKHHHENEVFLPDCPRFDMPGSNATILPDPFNCTAFYMCSNGEPFHMACPDELQFNDKLKVCDWPQNVNCNEEEEGSGSTLELL